MKQTSTSASTNPQHSLKVELDKGNNLVDYFVTIGLSPDVILDNRLYQSSIDELNSNMSITPSILVKCPPFDKTTINVDESMIKHCFPNGYSIVENISEPAVECFSFILDNNYFSVRFPQKYFTCLVFYESLACYKVIYDKYHAIENHERISSDDKNTCDEVPVDVNYYAPKCICFVSLHPFFLDFAKILKSLYQYAKSNHISIPLEKVIANLLIEVPVPPRGLYSVEYILFNERISLTQSPMNKLPSVKIEIEKIFVHFQVGQIVEIFKHIMLETKILFFSSNISAIAPIVHGFLSLLYPFKYPFQVVTILPLDNLHFIESVSPYILGINMKYDFHVFSEYNIDLNDTTFLVVDIDNHVVDLNCDRLSQNKKALKEEYPDFPSYITTKLENKISEYIEIITVNSKKETRNSFCNKISHVFCRFMAGLLKNYSKFLNLDYYANHDSKTTNIEALYKVDEFLKSVGSTDRQFYKKLVTDTQMFTDFIYKRMIPKDSKEKLEILLFDEIIIQKENKKLFSKKQQTVFINSKLYEIKNSYPVQKYKKMNDREKNFFRNPLNRKKALRHFQDVKIDNQDDVAFSYPCFPTLITDVFFKSNAKEYFIPRNLNDELEPFNAEMVAKSHLNQIHVQQSEMENDIYLCWIQLWAISFWYNDPIEKGYRFQQLLKVLDKVIHHEMEIYNMLFEALNKHGDDYMILKLFERLIHYHLNPSYSIYTIVSKIVDKKNSTCRNIISFVSQYNFNDNFDHKKLRRRILKNKFDTDIFNEDVKFTIYDTCIQCQHTINIEALSRDFHNMKREVFWAVCPSCGASILPKLSIRFGIELNALNAVRKNTSTYDGAVLYSPLFLKYEYNNCLLKEFGIQLDVENFKRKYNGIFWASIWFFAIKNLDYEFLLPYEPKLELVLLKKANSHITVQRVKKLFISENYQFTTPITENNTTTENHLTKRISSRSKSSGLAMRHYISSEEKGSSQDNDMIGEESYADDNRQRSNSNDHSDIEVKLKESKFSISLCPTYARSLKKKTTLIDVSHRQLYLYRKSFVSSETMPKFDNQ